MNKSIVWTKEYQVSFATKFPKLIVSKHEANHFCGGVLYYEVVSEPDTKTLTMKLESFTALTEELVFEKCEAWIKSHMGPDFTTKEICLA